MSSLPPVRKPKFYFDTAANPSHVTFDDGKVQRRNLPWVHYVESRWEYAEPDTIWVEIGDWVVKLHGYNLGPLFAAIEEQTLVRVRAMPDLARDSDQGNDTFVIEVRFSKPPEKNTPRRQLELDLGG